MPSYCIELKLKVKKDSDRNYLQNYFNAVAKLGNEIRRFVTGARASVKRTVCHRWFLRAYKVRTSEISLRNAEAFEIRAF